MHIFRLISLCIHAVEKVALKTESTTSINIKSTVFKPLLGTAADKLIIIPKSAQQTMCGRLNLLKMMKRLYNSHYHMQRHIQSLGSCHNNGRTGAVRETTETKQDNEDKTTT